MTSHDEGFREKRDDALRVSYQAPARVPVICLDEMTGTQALERAHPDLPMRAGPRGASSNTSGTARRV